MHLNTTAYISEYLHCNLRIKDAEHEKWTFNYHRGGYKRRKRREVAHQHASLTAFTLMRSHHEEKQKYGNFNKGLFFSINSWFWLNGEDVRLDIPERHSLQQRMTGNNEEILPQTLSPAERSHEWIKKKIKKLLNCGIIKVNNFPFNFEPLFIANLHQESLIKPTLTQTKMCSAGGINKAMCSGR